MSELKLALMDQKDGKRPDGVNPIIIHGKMASDWCGTLQRGALDTFAVFYMAQTSTIEEAAESMVETRKIEKYAIFLAWYIFQPIGFEITGACGPCAIAFMRELGKRIREHNCDPKTMEFLKQRLAPMCQVGPGHCREK